MSTTKTTSNNSNAPARVQGDTHRARSAAASGEVMTETNAETQAPEHTDPTPTPPNAPARLFLATTIAAVVATPLAWLLSYGATLPFFLGVFFFALFGIIAGAVVFRFASPKKPYGKMAVLFATTALVAYIFAFALVKESTDLPHDLAKKAVKKTADLGGRTAKEYRADVASEVRTHLAEQYPPGGTFGYIRWALADGKIKRGHLPSVNADLSGPQSGVTFAIRIVLSLALLAFGVGSQTLTLHKQSGTSST